MVGEKEYRMVRKIYQSDPVSNKLPLAIKCVVQKDTDGGFAFSFTVCNMSITLNSATVPKEGLPDVPKLIMEMARVLHAAIEDGIEP
jgi:hypothetical protein